MENEPSESNREKQLPNKVHVLALGSTTGRLPDIDLKTALERLKNQYKDPRKALLSSSMDNPLMIGKFCYWI